MKMFKVTVSDGIYWVFLCRATDCDTCDIRFTCYTIGEILIEDGEINNE